MWLKLCALIPTCRIQAELTASKLKRRLKQKPFVNPQRRHVKSSLRKAGVYQAALGRFEKRLPHELQKFMRWGDEVGPVGVHSMEIQTVDRADLPFVPSNKKLRRLLWDKRNTEREKQEANDPGAADAEYKDLLTMVLPEVHGEDFVLYDSGPGPDRIVMFGTQTTLDHFILKKIC